MVILRRTMSPSSRLICPLLLLQSLLSSIIYASASTSNGNGNLLSPIRHLDSSLAASSAQGTAVAVLAIDEEKEEECVVILSCSPQGGGSDESGWNLTADALTSASSSVEDAAKEEAEGDQQETMPKTGEGSRLTFLPQGSVQIPLHHRRTSQQQQDFVETDESRILHVLHPQSGICCAVTGFASDARHLVNVAARYVSDHEHLYGNSSSSGVGAGGGPTVHKVVRDVLAKKMAGAAFASGGRPYGLQFLVVGNRSAGGRSSSSLQMYTIDPSGGWRHWGGGGTAVGRNAALVRKKLHSALTNGSENQDTDELVVENEKVAPSRPRKWSDALDIAMRVLIESTHDDDDLVSRAEMMSDDETNNEGGRRYDNHKMRSQYDAIVVFGQKKRRNSLCAAIDREKVAASYWNCIGHIAKEKKQSS